MFAINQSLTLPTATTRKMKGGEDEIRYSCAQTIPAFWSCGNYKTEFYYSGRLTPEASNLPSPPVRGHHTRRAFLILGVSAALGAGKALLKLSSQDNV